MIELSLREVAKICRGKILPGSTDDIHIRGLATDSRAEQSDVLFVALSGPHFDANDFVEQARGNGAAAALVNRALPGPGVLVADTLQALQDLASAWRQSCTAKVIGVTGSCGKTTVKEILATILQETGPGIATRGNLNNHIGVPLTLARLSQKDRYAVVEMGMNHAGEIRVLSRMAAPDLVIINNAGTAHLENLGTVEAIAAAKGEILEGLGTQGIAVLNGDDTFCEYWAERAPGEVWRFSLEDRPARVHGSWRGNAQGGEMEVRAPQGSFDLQIPLLGRHNGANVLAAVTAALAIDTPIPAIMRSIAQLRSVSGRLQWLPGLRGSRLLDDSYNANPASLEAAMQVLAQQPGQRFLVLGDMGELGPEARAYHAQAGKRLRDLGINGLFATGSLTAAAVESFGTGATHFADVDALVTALQPVLAANVTVLVKGSRAARMERVVSALRQEAG
ncbi:UDP-N-acetylmuramoyl-tripeptide--D-alanyl-D-alanine ligase [Acidithiobacillus sp. IBUN Pt1247-S3]|uniref:UDP-N-acetylmuramoyl-tripeptide--D-alanyl-D- alanine ligase n=1 Tax=Acidithiobacillus sp. IBUN Pt1247-S3 TaxID=3166642 RepID=UPI0034E59E1E